MQHAESGRPPLYQDVFGETILELARVDDRIVGITPAMPTGCSLNRMMAEMPERCFDVGIAEGHAVTFSAGLAAAGMIPFCNIYSSFMQRAYDNVIHDVALQHLNVVMCLDRAGLVGEDGPTHHGVFDIACMRSIPNLTIASPMNEIELRNLMYTASLGRGPFVIRYPKGEGVTPQWRQPFEEVPLGRSRLLCDGSDVAVLTFGPVGNAAAAAIRRAAAEGVSAAHIDLRFAKPLDTDRLHATGRKFRRIVTVEDGAIAGGRRIGRARVHEPQRLCAQDRHARRVRSFRPSGNPVAAPRNLRHRRTKHLRGDYEKQTAINERPMEYDFREIEKKWQKRWAERGTYRVKEDPSRPKYYVLDMFPYPSGAGLHVGHPLGYIASDIYTRYKRLKGFNVLHPMGYDAFGLPAEQYAIQTGQHPAVTTERNIARYREQLDQDRFQFRLGSRRCVLATRNITIGRNGPF